MSIRRRRESLLKSSISINTIRDSAVNFTDGLSKSNTTARNIAQKTNENNNFKRRLIGKDNEFFRRRRENVRRKDREDELEASSVQGIAKRTGSITAASTRGFLGRILDFFGIILIGWFVNNLPQILEGINKLIKRISSIVGILTGFIGAITNFLVDFGVSIVTATKNLFKYPFSQVEQQSREDLQKSSDGISKLNQRLINTFNLFGDPANVGLKSFKEGLIIKTDGEEPKKDQQEEPENKVTDTTTDDTKPTEEPKPQGFMRGLTGLVDFATFGMTDLDRRGDLFGNKVEEKEEEPNYRMVTAGKEQEEEKKDNADMVTGVNNQNEIKDLQSKEAQSQGETVETKNQETQGENDEQKENDGILAKINGFMSNMFGTKTKRNEEKENETQTLSEVEEKAKELQGKSEELKTAMDKFASSIEPNNEKIEGITPTVRQRQNLGDRKTSSNTIVYIVDAPANVGSDGSVGSIGPTGGGATPSLKNMNQDQTRDIMKKIQKVMLQS